MVIGLLPTAVTTGAWAQEFRAADPQREDCSAICSQRHLRPLIAERRSGGGHHAHQLGEENEIIEQTRIGAIGRYAGCPAAAELTERIRRVI
jgi:hypothetical protein